MKYIKVCTVILTLIISQNSFSQEQTNFSTIIEIDSLSSDLFWIKLQGYSNSTCGDSRILFKKIDLGNEYYKDIVAMILSLFHSGTNVSLVVNANCEGLRLIARKS